VAVEDPFSVGAGECLGAVGVERDGPAPLVDEDEVVESTEENEVAEAGGAALCSGDDVVGVLRHEAQCYIARAASRDERSYLWI
jgi:hypothetical protein